MLNGGDILLIRPPALYRPETMGGTVGIPLGLMYVAAALRRQGIPVQIYDARVDCSPRRRLEPDPASGLLGASWEEVARLIQERRPAIVGISNEYSAQLRAAIRCAEVVKEVDSGMLTVVGGPHASVQPETFFQRTNSVDVVVRGEGECVMPQIARCHAEGGRLEDVPSLAFRADGGVRRTRAAPFIQNLDELPFPAYDLVPLEAYFEMPLEAGGIRMQRPRLEYEGAERAISFITSRGCPYDCSFCSVHGHMGRHFRYHSAEYVVAHLRHVIRDLGVRHIHFEDDNLTLRVRRFLDILRRARDEGLHFTWDTPNGVRADTLDEAALREFAASGCTFLCAGVESGDQEVLDRIIGKRLDLSKVQRFASLARKARVDVRAFYVIGFPGETIGNMRKTAAFALEMERRYGVLPYLFTATPLPGTRLYEEVVRNNYLARELSDEELAVATQTGGIIRTPDFGPEDVARERALFEQAHGRLIKWNFLKYLLTSPRLLARFVKEATRCRSLAALRGLARDFVLYPCFLARSRALRLKRPS